MLLQVADAAFEKAGVSERTQVWLQVGLRDDGPQHLGSRFLV
jgi:hypothetical protein